MSGLDALVILAAFVASLLSQEWWGRWLRRRMWQEIRHEKGISESALHAKLTRLVGSRHMSPRDAAYLMVRAELSSARIASGEQS